MASPVVRALARVASRLFYRVDRVGRAPGQGAVLLLPNHQNSLLDPAVVWSTAGRDDRFLAKSTLFRTPLRPLLAGAGAIPVYRRRDEGVDPSKNVETFADVERALAAGDAVCVFPEGISHSSGTAGAAAHRRGAHGPGAERRSVDRDCPGRAQLRRKTAFRSRVTAVYGRRSHARICSRRRRRRGRATAD
jgi:1-acyl-sn-glycerol-3-phosphate acyltransferase